MRSINIFSTLILMAGLLLTGPHAGGQTPTDDLLMPAGDICVLASYDYGSFDQYWEAGRLRENQTIATVRRSTFLTMAAIGISDKLNFYAGVPYIKTGSSEPNGGKLAGARGFQDINLALKYEAIYKQFSGGAFSALATVGFSTPVSNYLSDYMPLNLGLGASELSYRGILQYRLDKGLYLRTSAAYLWRGYTKAERNYYYNNGSYYTPWMDVPSAWSLEGVLGMWLLDDALRIELSYAGLRSTSGDDIRPYNAPQPTNKVNSDRVGIFAQYHFQFINGLGIIAYHNRVFNGLNAPKINNTGIGLFYQFTFLKHKN